jgi:hypothetical protein
MPKDVYDHFQNKWVSFDTRSRVKDIFLGLLTSVCVFIMSLLILCGLIGG